MARPKRKYTTRQLVLVAAAYLLVGAFVGAAGWAIYEAPVRCEADPNAKVMGRCDGGVCGYSVERCEDGSMRLRQSQFIPLNDEAPVPDTDAEGPKADI